VTGVSRREGIGWATARRLAERGVTVFTQGWAAHDAEQPWGADEGFEPGGHLDLDLSEPEAPARLIAAAVAEVGPLDVLVANHAASADQNLEQLTADVIDRTLTVNVRATLLLVQAFAAQAGGPGRVILLTSGQGRGPMARELPYVASKAAVSGLVGSLADHLAPRGITVNAVNPGPTDTGWATPEILEQARAAMPRGRWGTPDDAARLIAWLASEDADWVTGQVIDSDGGFRYGGA
jgi:3-oxoacyl-[acyl-carrier protein] reductase